MKKVQVTPRQKQIIILLARGFNRKEIAAKLHLTLRGVDYHISGAYKTKTSHSIREKLGSMDLAWLTHFAIFTGWVQLGDCKK